MGRDNFVTVGIFWFITPTLMVSYEQKRDISALEDFDTGIVIFDKTSQIIKEDDIIFIPYTTFSLI